MQPMRATLRLQNVLELRAELMITCSVGELMAVYARLQEGLKINPHADADRFADLIAQVIAKAKEQYEATSEFQE